MSVRAELPEEKAGPKSMSLHAVVKGKDKDDVAWKDVTDLISVSATGASFNLPRKCETGTLISLLIALPTQMRCYDFDKDFYRVWGLVQYCSPLATENESSFHLGVAFIGKSCPESYTADPSKHYRISGVDQDGMWRVAELQTSFKKRADVRFWQPVELYLALIDTKDGATGGERTVAENVSRNGAAVFTTMTVGIGDRVKFISEEYDFSGLAVVCNTQLSEDKRTRLHLRFVENNFPVEKLMKSGASVEKV